MPLHMLIIMVRSELYRVSAPKERTISNPGTIRVTKGSFYAEVIASKKPGNILKMFGFSLPVNVLEVVLTRF